jgi:hypothetical protein
MRQRRQASASTVKFEREGKSAMLTGSEETELDKLDDELSQGLGHDAVSDASVVPDSGPPSSVGLVVLEFPAVRERRREKSEERSARCRLGTIGQDRRQLTSRRARCRACRPFAGSRRKQGYQR